MRGYRMLVWNVINFVEFQCMEFTRLNCLAYMFVVVH